MNLNNPENFAGRVSNAAYVISRGLRSTRGFENCFENYDSDAVVPALLRRAKTRGWAKTCRTM